MEAVNRKSRAATAYKKFTEQYPNETGGQVVVAGLVDPKHTTGEHLKLLGENPDPDEVDRVIGNTTWTYSTCTICHREVDAIVKIETYDSSIQMCQGCLELALEKLEDN